MKKRARLRARWPVALRLLGLALLVAVVLVATERATRPLVERNLAAQTLDILRPLLPEGGYDNNPARDAIRVSSPDLPGSALSALPVYRARRQGEPVAAVLTVIAPAGYVGPIRLLVSLRVDGTVLGVHAQSQRETPGLGGIIGEADSPWLARFVGRSLTDPAQDDWAVRSDGGAFDEVTGATVTSRAVVTAVRDAALYFRAHRDEIFSRPAA